MEPELPRKPELPRRSFLRLAAALAAPSPVRTNIAQATGSPTLVESAAISEEAKQLLWKWLALNGHLQEYRVDPELVRMMPENIKKIANCNPIRTLNILGQELYVRGQVNPFGDDQEDFPIPNNPSEFMRTVRGAIQAVRDHQEALKNVALGISAHKDEILRFFEQIKPHGYYDGDLVCWGRDNAGNDFILKPFNATAEEITMVAQNMGSDDIAMALDHTAIRIGPQHLTPQELKLIPEEEWEYGHRVNDPEWRSFFDKPPTLANGASARKTLVITTGGTIESEYSPQEGTPHMVPLSGNPEDTCIPAALQRIGRRESCDVYPVAQRDSKQVTPANLDHILWYAATHDYENIVIVHGTDTMPDHARYMARRLKEWGDEHGVDQKTFVFTGAMTPLRDEHGAWRRESDGFQNLEKALDDAQHQPPGVYIEMGQGPTKPDCVKKRVETETIATADGTPTTRVTYAAFERDDPARHCDMHL